MATRKFKETVVLIVVFVLSAIWAYNSLLAEQEDNAKLEKFSSYYEVGSDGYCIDSILYVHPSWSYDQAEDYLLGH